MTTIGISGYIEQPLQNPIADAYAVAAAFRSWGCDVEVMVDPSSREITDAAARLAAAKAVPSVLYIAGHGFVDESGDQRVLGVRGKVGEASDSIKLDTITDILADSRLPSILVLDTCRTGGDQKAVAQSERANGPLMVVASTSMGQVALDQPQASLGLFAQHFVAALLDETDFASVCARTRREVAAASGGRQVPTFTNEISWRRPRIDTTTEGSVRETRLESWYGLSANDAIKNCARRQGRIPNPSDFPTSAPVSAFWIDRADGKGNCGAFGGAWHPSFDSPRQIRWFPCDKPQSTVVSLCLLPMTSAN